MYVNVVVWVGFCRTEILPVRQTQRAIREIVFVMLFIMGVTPHSDPKLSSKYYMYVDVFLV